MFWIYSLIILLGWLALALIAQYFTDKKVTRLGTWLLNISVIWILIAIIYAIYLYITFIVENTWLLSPSIFVIGIISITSFIYKFIFPSEKMAFQIKELSKYQDFAALLLFFTPIVIGVGLYVLQLHLETETTRVLYSTIFVAFCSLLVLVLMFSIFIIERRIHQRIVNLLIQSVKGLSIMYGVTIFLSILSLITLPSYPIIFDLLKSDLINSIMPALLLGTVTLALNSIWLTIIIFFQVVDVLKEEVLPFGPQSKVVFDETRLFSTGWEYECSNFKY